MTSQMETIIDARNMAVGYDGTVVLEDLNFQINKGEITVILGKSGCGKTTIMKTLIGLLPPIRGDISFFGSVVDYHSEPSLKELYSRIGVLYQGSALLNSFSLFHNTALPLRMHHRDLPEEIEREMVHARLAQVGLLESRDKFPSELSGGMRKRAALARAMITDPEIIFCDEPSAGLDPITAAGLDRLMINLKNLFGITFVVVTHELRSIDAIADKALVLNNQSLHFFGDYLELMRSDDEFTNTFFLKEKGSSHDQ